MNKRSVLFSPPDISELEIEEIAATLRSGWITTGPRTKKFERNISEYCGTSKTVCLNSATAALETTLRVLGVGSGDEVITSAYTYTASASVIEHVGAKIVLVDVEPDTYHIDYNKLAEAITERTKVVIPVDIGGVMVDYNKVFAAVESKKTLFHPSENRYQRLFNRAIVMADSAHSFGASWHGKMCGAVADFTCFSFHAVKNLTTSEGGAVTWLDRDGLDNDEIYKEYQLLSLHGQSKDAHEKFGPGGWEYDIMCTGYKCNMTDITAAFGIKQLERFPALTQRRSDIFSMYDEKLLPLGIERLEHNGADYQGNYHLFMLRAPGMTLEQRNAVMAEMASRFSVACNVHFKPLPMMTAYKNLGFNISDYPNAYKQFANEITLPMHTKLTNDDVEYVTDAAIEVFKTVGFGTTQVY